MVERIDPSSGDLERELREHLRARSAPPNFTDRVMARIPAREPAPRPSRWFAWRPLWGWAALATVLAVTVFGGVEHDRQQRIAGERARSQVLLALRITGSTLRQVQAKVNDQTSTAPNGASVQ